VLSGWKDGKINDDIYSRAVGFEPKRDEMLEDL